MHAPRLDFSSLAKALDSLDRGLARALGAPGDEELRDAVIQRFEYSYELCWRMLRRSLEREAASAADIAALSFREMIREGAARGLIAEPEAWFGFRDQRNATSHAYDAAKAAEVFAAAGPFLAAGRALLAGLEARQGANGE